MMYEGAYDTIFCFAIFLNTIFLLFPDETDETTWHGIT